MTSAKIKPVGGAAANARDGMGSSPTSPPEAARLLSLAESIGNMGHFFWQVTTGEMSWSGQVNRMFGVEAESFAPSYAALLDLVHADDRETVKAELGRAVANRAGFEFDMRVVRLGGEARHMIVRGQPELEDDGAMKGMIGVITDVTEAFAAIRSIHDQHEMLDIAAEVAHLGHWVWNASERHVTFCSDELARIHEMSPVVFKGRFPDPRQISTVVAPRDRQAYYETIGRSLETASPYQIEYELETRFATAKYIREIGQPIFDRAGRFNRFVSTVQDVTDAKRRELMLSSAKVALEAQAQALKRSENRFRDMVEGSIQGILVLRGGRPVFANQAIANLLGLSAPEEVLGIADFGAMAADSADQAAMLASPNSAHAGSEAGLKRIALRTVDGRKVWIDAVGRSVEWDGEEARLLTLIEVTDRHLAEEAIRQKTTELEQLNLQKDKLFSIIAHDLKGPFNSVLGFAGLLAAKARTMPPEKVSEYANLVYDAATSVHDLLDNLLAWASVQMRDAALRLTRVSLSHIVDASFYPLRAMAGEKGVVFVNNVGNLTVDADENMIRIVLRNLISNGIKFTPAGGRVLMSAELVAAGTGPGASRLVEITVRDSGVGMTPEFASNLFNIGRKVSMAGTSGERGTGLGLFLCRDIVARHGGTFTVDSAVGRGTAFRFTLPATENA